jgi:prepilin-type N-terminal cleavage/methylation domain-containing protein
MNRRCDFMTTMPATRRTAFTLFELLCVVIVVGLLATLLVPRAVDARNEAAEKACYHNRALINSAIERYAVATGSYPALADLDAPDYFPQGLPTCPVSGSAYTIDAATQRVHGHSGGVHP